MFPSEAIQSDVSPGTSRALIPIMLVIGSALTAAGIGLIGFRVNIFGGLFFTCWGLAYLLAWGPLTYYSIKRWIMRSREDRGLGVSQSSKELDSYIVPVRRGWGVIAFGGIQTGSASPSPGITAIRVIAVVNYSVLFVSMILSAATTTPR